MTITIRHAMRQGAGWLNASCKAGAVQPKDRCVYSRPITLAWAAILWGLDAPLEKVRNRLTCSRCGRRGVSLEMPAPVCSFAVEVFHPPPPRPHVWPCPRALPRWRLAA